MKKIILSLLVLIAYAGVNAQTIIYSEDFSGGIPAGWGNDGTSNGAPNNWVKWRTTITGAHGAYSASYGRISSPTQANGVAIFDSDSLDCGGHTLASGQPDQSRGPANAPQHCQMTTSAINVSGHPYLRLQFYQYLANFYTTTYFGVSTDSVSWTYDTLNVNQTVNTATAVANERIQRDISALVNGQPNVYLRFVFDGEYYDWQIDDISIMELPNNDLDILSSAGSTGTSAFDLFYASIPLSQADSFTAATAYSNIGIVTQPNCTANFQEIKGVSVIATQTSSPPVNLPYSFDTIAAARFAPAGIGSYKVAISVLSDSADYDPTNNADTVKFAIADSVYSINTSLAAHSISYFLLRSNAGVTFRLGTMFEVTHADTVSSITSAFAGGATGTHAGAQVRATIYAVTDTTIAGNRTLYYNNPTISTYTKTLTAANITAANAANVIPVTMPIDLSSGASNASILASGLYWAAIEGISPAPGDSMVLAATTGLQKNGFPLVEENGTLFYLSNTEAPLCNMNFGHVDNLLQVDYTRNPSAYYVNTNQSVAFTGLSNASNAATYRWDISGFNTGFSDTRYGRNMLDTFRLIDSFYICLTVTDNGHSASKCKVLHDRSLYVHSTIYDTICAGGSLTVGSYIHTTAGIYSDTLFGQGAQGTADSVIALHLYVRPQAVLNMSDSICAGSSVSFGGHTYSQAGVYRDTIHSINSCDTIMVLHLYMLGGAGSSFSRTICTGLSYNFNGRILTSAGTYTDTLTSIAGCDSVVTLNLSVSGTIVTPISQSVCSGHSYQFHGHALTQGGTYRDTTTSVGGCDSITILSLTVSSPSGVSLSETICQGSSYSFFGHSLTQAGIYKDTLTSAAGCDSIITTLTLTVNSLPSQPVISQAGATLTSSASGALHYQWQLNGTNIFGDTTAVITPTQSGIYILVVTDANGCSISSGAYQYTLGIDELSLSTANLTIRPNPASGYCTVSTTAVKGSLVVSLFDLSGREIEQLGEMKDGKLDFSVSHLAKGTYIIRVKQEGEISLPKMLVVE